MSSTRISRYRFSGAPGISSRTSLVRPDDSAQPKLFCWPKLRQADNAARISVEQDAEKRGSLQLGIEVYALATVQVEAKSLNIH
jgi:hypothetical protein